MNSDHMLALFLDTLLIYIGKTSQTYLGRENPMKINILLNFCVLMIFLWILRKLIIYTIAYLMTMLCVEQPPTALYARYIF